MNFNQRLNIAIEHHHSLLCIGLDPDVVRLPASVRHDADAVYTFCHEIIAATHDVAVAYKPNIAFFEAMGVTGIETLMRLMHHTRQNIWILDAKRGDIGNTASAYAHAAFGHFHADAITLNPYMGGDTLEPFLTHADRGAFLLCRTSNPGSRDIQELRLADGRPLYLAVAELAAQQWNTNQNVGLVVGATQPDALKAVRTICPDLPFLLPGIGAQGGDLVEALNAGLDARRSGLLINASRSILYASNAEDYAHAARAEAIRTRDAINTIRDAR
ncbi:MAG: orotidine-5'-phosphate decarboxylase [Chloroflexi bacterium]|nr:orotidine-5'-phosphate decarboxylase [Chloroflexota bacterium]